MKQILLLISFFISLTIHAQDGKLPHSFIENFNDSVLENFRYGSTGNKAAFKWKSGVTSKTEPGSKVLLFKIDPMDSAGAGRGPAELYLMTLLILVLILPGWKFLM